MVGVGSWVGDGLYRLGPDAMWRPCAKSEFGSPLDFWGVASASRRQHDHQKRPIGRGGMCVSSHFFHLLSEIAIISSPELRPHPPVTPPYRSCSTRLLPRLFFLFLAAAYNNSSRSHGLAGGVTSDDTNNTHRVLKKQTRRVFQWQQKDIHRFGEEQNIYCSKGGGEMG